MPLDVTIRSTRAEDWREVRALRLEMLADTPIAYGDSLESASRRGETYWRERAARGDGDRTASFAAIAADGRWVATMSGYLSPVGPVLVSVYVAPSHRGTEVTSMLLERIEAWALTHADRLLLEVHEDNARAIAAYLRRGFAFTGASRPYELDESRAEREMAKPLR